MSRDDVKASVKEEDWDTLLSADQLKVLQQSKKKLLLILLISVITKYVYRFEALIMFFLID